MIPRQFSRRIIFSLIFCCSLVAPLTAQRSHPRLMADAAEIDTARQWIKRYSWYRNLFDQHKAVIDRFLQRRPIFVSPVKQIYQYKMYTCPSHDVELLYEEFQPHEHRCPKDTMEIYSGGKYDAAWAGWYNRLLAGHLVWTGLLYQAYGEEKYAEAGREILMQFADVYLKYPTTNTILGPAHVFFGTLSESFWGVDMAYGYDLLYNYRGFTKEDHATLKEKLFYPLAKITQLFPESASNRQLWYNNVSAAVGFLYDDQELIDFALKGKYGFYWQLRSALPESGFWAEWSGYHFVALRGMIHLAEMARHNGMDFYHMEIAGRSMKKMFDVPFDLILPNYEFPRLKDSGGGNILEYSTYYEVGYAVYRDPKYLALLNLTNVTRGKQVVGETSAIGEADQPITLFQITPELPALTADIYPLHSSNLEGNGFAALRNGSGNDRRYLYLDYGIMGGEHGHPDRLQIGYYANGRNWIVDPLNESYFNPNLQLWFRQTIAHPTVVVNQTSQTWTNGYGIFFSALPGLQVASGATETAYPGAKLTRTLLQIGDYFIDLFDVAAPEKRILDWPLHSFGSLQLTGLDLKPEPNDLFGHRPGIPGYDQLTQIRSARTDGSWSGVFTDHHQHLLVRAIGDKGTQVFQSISPHIGGFYKQMVKDPQPMSTVFTRRVADTTRFAHLIHAYASQPSVLDFRRGSDPRSFSVRRETGTDLLFADIERSMYFVLRQEGGEPKLLAGFNIKEIDHSQRLLFSSEFPLSQVECEWKGERLVVHLPSEYSRIKIWAPHVRSVEINGVHFSPQREGEYILLQGKAAPAIEYVAPHDTTLYLGKKNRLSVRVWNPTKAPIEDSVRIELSNDWKERMESQLEWWGGIVNLKATNKCPIEQKLYPTEYREDGNWISGKQSASRRIALGRSETFMFDIDVPFDAAPVTLPVIMRFGDQGIRKSISVSPPITATIVFPNGQKEVVWVELQNKTPESQSVSLEIQPDPAWKVLASRQQSVKLGPHQSKRITFPLRLTGYSAESQRFPFRCDIVSGSFRTLIVRDLYVGTSHYARKAPSLDGSWNGWNMSRPVTIDRENQIGRLLFGNQPWRGVKDLSARIYSMYDEKYLYIGAEVKDDSVVIDWNFPIMSYPWDTDCIEVVLDTRMTSEQGHDPPTPGLFRHLSMAQNRTTDFGPSMWQGGGAGGPLLPKPNLVPGAETYFSKTFDGYTMICRYPLSSVGSIIAKPGYKIGFDLAINDNDGTTYRKNQHIWAGFSQNQSWWDMGTIGALIFGPR